MCEAHSLGFLFSNIKGEKHVHFKKMQKPIKKRTLQCTQFFPQGQAERENELHMTAVRVWFCLMQCRHWKGWHRNPKQNETYHRAIRKLCGNAHCYGCIMPVDKS